jgi:hypothetical protein
MLYGGWIRQAGQLQPRPLGSGTITIELPCQAIRLRLNVLRPGT